MAVANNHHHLSFHLHIPHLHLLHHDHQEAKRKQIIPKGCVAILVGQEEEELQRFVIPVMYVNHPLFSPLLKEAEEEYGFEQQGPITIPCHVQQFRNVQGLIDKEERHHHHHHHHHHARCFNA